MILHYLVRAYWRLYNLDLKYGWFKWEVYEGYIITFNKYKHLTDYNIFFEDGSYMSRLSAINWDDDWFENCILDRKEYYYLQELKHKEK